MNKVDFGVVFALSQESGCFVDMLSRVRVTRGDGFTVRRGFCGEREVVVVESGPGRQRAAKTAHALIDAFRPRIVVSAGFAGGLDPRVKRHDLVAAESLVDADGREIAPRSGGACAWLERCAKLAPRLTAHGGPNRPPRRREAAAWRRAPGSGRRYGIIRRGRGLPRRAMSPSSSSARSATPWMTSFRRTSGTCSRGSRSPGNSARRSDRSFAAPAQSRTSSISTRPRWSAPPGWPGFSSARSTAFRRK